MGHFCLQRFRHPKGHERFLVIFAIRAIAAGVEGFKMKNWINLFLATMLLAQTHVTAGGTGDISGSGRSTFNAPVFGVPIGSVPDPKTDEDKKREEEQIKGQEKKKQIMDKKVDDAIKKAWGEK